MAIYNYSNKEILENDFHSGRLDEASITNSDLDNLCSSNIIWNKTEVRNTNCNEAVFSNSTLIECNFFRSSLINSQFSSCKLNENTLQGLSLIKVKFKNSKLQKTLFDSCTMQRADFSKCIIQNSTIKDIEGIYAVFSNTVFINCFFELTYGNGMNGFSSATFENCLFYNCHFTGYPLRGAKTKGCTFIACSGEITDDIESDCCYGLPRIPQTVSFELTNYNYAVNLLNEVSNG